MVVRADASPAIGSGHVMRCLALAKAWQETGGAVTYLSAEMIPAVEQRLASESVAVRRIAGMPGIAEDADAVVAAARAANWVVVDGYRFAPDYIRRLKSGGLRVLFFDDDGRFEFYGADVILNQNISASAAMYDQRETFTRLLLGSEYALLRPEFLAETKTREHPNVARKILVTMGGSDPDNVTKMVLLALARIDMEFEARIVIGGGNSRIAELDAIAGKYPGKLRLEVNPPNMAPLMRWADVAISGAGSTCWELAYMGVPSMVIALSRDQQAIAQGLADREIAVSLGWHASLSEERISEALEHLLTDRGRRVAMSERGQKLVDGQGAARVVKFLQSSL